ncbi:MAG TPA: 5'-3' exonuclease H3TH domain-containing protein [Acidimicrobiales bacterium]|nr:5'-3' exonuclease H3TH domain-containing protein [Acidimicrobiales bacterium]
MIRVHLIDGTYELFRHFYGQRDESTRTGTAAVRGVLSTVLHSIEDGASHIAVATDHVIESFRNRLWTGYKTSAGMDPELLRVFPLLEEALMAMGVATYAMVELEADDALATLAAVAAEDDDVEQVVIWTPDKDLGQCVREDERVVQVDRRAAKVINADAVREKFGVDPASIPDFLALVGDSADGFPGLPGFGAKSAAALLKHYKHIEHIPDAPGQWEVTLRGGGTLAATLAGNRELVGLFKELATLRIDRSLITGVKELEWSGPTPEFAAVSKQYDGEYIVGKATALAS